jgi:hypothetical protein
LVLPAAQLHNCQVHFVELATRNHNPAHTDFLDKKCHKQTLQNQFPLHCNARKYSEELPL